MAGNGAEAEEGTFVLGISAKGLLLKSNTSDAFEDGMGRVIGVLFD